MYAIYARQSADKADSISIETQIDFCKKKINEGGRFEIFADKGYSGGSTERPAFKAMLLFCAKNKNTVILTYKLDRISRSLVDFVLLLERLKENGTELVSCTESFSSKSEMGLLIMKLLVMFAEMERKNIRLRVRDNYYARAQKGFYLGGYPPLGYKKTAITIEGKKSCGYEIVESEKEVVKFIFKSYLCGSTINELCRELNRQGEKTKKGSCFSAAAVARILRNPFYVAAEKKTLAFFISRGAKVLCGEDLFNGSCGCVFFHSKDKTYGGKGDSFTGEFISVGRHMPIIASSIWLEVQKKLSAKSNKLTQRSQKSYLSGLVKCGYNGKKLTLSSSGLNVYFYCRQRKENSCPFNCKGKTLVKNGRQLEGYVSQVMKKYLLYLAQISVHLQTDEQEILAAKLRLLERKLNKIKEEIIKSENDEVVSFLKESISELTAERSRLTFKSKKQLALGREKCYTELKGAAEEWDILPLQLKRTLAAMVIEGVYLSDGEVLIILK